MCCGDHAVVLFRVDLTAEAKLKRGKIVLLGVDGISLPLRQEDGAHEIVGGVDLLLILRFIVVLLQAGGVQALGLCRQLAELSAVLKRGVECVGNFQLLYSFR